MIGPSIPEHILSTDSTARPADDDSPTGPQSTIGSQVPTFPSPAQAAPAVPPLQAEANEDEDEDEDDYMPALPPDMLPGRNSGSTSSVSSAKRVIGPSVRPSLAYGRYDGGEDDDSEDDDYGPTPLPAGLQVEEKDGVTEFLEKEEKRRKQIEEASKPKALKREEWMLVPPSSSDLLGSIDPTKLNRPRKFAPTSTTPRNADSSLWTETPAERQQRIADEVAGKRRRVTEVDAMNPDEEREFRKRRKHEEEVRKGVEEHTKKVRGATLLVQHSKASGKDEKSDDDGPPAIWDHSRDMALSGRLMDDKSREKAIRDARGLADRFGSGKRGGFL